jgi:hypothetical protein
MKALTGSRGIVPLILELGTRWISSPLYSRETTPVPTEQEAERVLEALWTFP